MADDLDVGTIYVSVRGQPAQEDSTQGMAVQWWDIDQCRWRIAFFRMPVDDMRFKLMSDYPERRLVFQQVKART